MPSSSWTCRKTSCRAAPSGFPAARDIAWVDDLMDRHDLIVATKDWHPAGHGSFAANHEGKRPGDVIDLNGLPQILWPIHCVQNTPGAEFVEGLDAGRIDQVFHKGVDADIDSYSGFYDNGHRRSTGLGEYLKGQDVGLVTVIGVATDYCIKFTALDAVRLGFKTRLLRVAIRGVELREGDISRAMDEIRDAGVQVMPVPLGDFQGVQRIRVFYN